MRFLCALRTIWYTARLWATGNGWLGVVVEGHRYGEPVYALGLRTDPESGEVFRAEWEVLRCRCGHESRAWRPLHA